MSHSFLRLAFVLVGLVLSASFAAESDPTGAPIKNGNLAAVRFLPVSRIRASEGAPDGLTFYFVVARPAGVGPLALKETRDFTLGAVSYQAKTKAELGKVFEPHTVVDDADRFFAQRTDFARFAPKNLSAAKVITIAIRGAKLEAKDNVEVTLNVGTGRQIEPFTFSATVPEI